MKEKIIAILETDLADGNPITLGEIADKIIAVKVAEAMPTEEWRYCPKCGTEWTNDCEQFGCWQCGNVRNRMEREKSLVDDDAMCHCTDPSLDRNGYCRECGGEINRMSEPNKEGREK